MAFTSTITERFYIGNKAAARGTFTSDSGSTGGDVNTGLRYCESIYFVPQTSAPAGQCAVNETLPVAGSAVTIVTSADVVGYWEAIGDIHA